MAVLLAFVFAAPLHLKPATIALAGAAVLMLLDNWRHRGSVQADHVHQTFADVEWTTIFFFIGLFIVVHAVEVTGVLDLLAQKLVAATGGNIAAAGTAILWLSAILSAILDNIPFVATMIPLIKGTAPAFGGPDALTPLWWCLALGACLGGNGTLGRRLGQPHRRRHRRAERRALQLRALSRLRRADDARVDRHLPGLCVAAVFLKAAGVE